MRYSIGRPYFIAVAIQTPRYLDESGPVLAFELVGDGEKGSDAWAQLLRHRVELDAAVPGLRWKAPGAPWEPTTAHREGPKRAVVRVAMPLSPGLTSEYMGEWVASCASKALEVLAWSQRAPRTKWSAVEVAVPEQDPKAGRFGDQADESIMRAIRSLPRETEWLANNALLREGAEAHEALVDRIPDVARARGVLPRFTGLDSEVDLWWRDGRGRVVIVEVKSTHSANAAHQIRLGLGQVIDYRTVIESHGQMVRAAVAVTGSVDVARWRAACDSAGVAFVQEDDLDPLFEAVK
jgi:hypothetical protein